MIRSDIQKQREVQFRQAYVCKLGEILRNRGLRQCDLAKRLNLDESFLSQLVNNKSTPSLATAVAIADNLKLPVTEIWVSRSGTDS